MQKITAMLTRKMKTSLDADDTSDVNKETKTSPDAADNSNANKEKKTSPDGSKDHLPADSEVPANNSLMVDSSKEQTKSFSDEKIDDSPTYEQMAPDSGNEQILDSNMETYVKGDLSPNIEGDMFGSNGEGSDFDEDALLGGDENSSSSASQLYGDENYVLKPNTPDSALAQNASVNEVVPLTKEVKESPPGIINKEQTNFYANRHSSEGLVMMELSIIPPGTNK